MCATQLLASKLCSCISSGYLLGIWCRSQADKANSIDDIITGNGLKMCWMCVGIVQAFMHLESCMIHGGCFDQTRVQGNAVELGGLECPWHDISVECLWYGKATKSTPVCVHMHSRRVQTQYQ